MEIFDLLKLWHLKKEPKAAAPPEPAEEGGKIEELFAKAAPYLRVSINPWVRS